MTAAGYIIATALRGSGRPVWDLHTGCAPDHPPHARELAQIRAADRNRCVRVFTVAQWDALAYGERDADWVHTDGGSGSLRERTEVVR